MAWLAVNKNGDETISPDKPTRWGDEWAKLCFVSSKNCGNEIQWDERFVTI